MTGTDAPENSPDKKIKKEKKRKKEYRVAYEPKKRARFGVGPAFFVWVAVLLFGLIFTQALHSTMSGVFYVTAMLIPIGALIYVLIAVPQMTASAVSGRGEAEKEQPVSFTVYVENPLPLPYPFVDVDITVPSETAVRSVNKRVSVSLAPGAGYELKTNVVFSYRGQYSIGVSDLYVWDLLRMFRVRVHMDSQAPIFVVPRRITMPGNADNGAADVDTDSAKTVFGAERSEVSDIRSYRMGDHMKSIHWKLSSKKQELITKEYTMNSGKTAYLFVDMVPRWESADPDLCEDDVNEYAADTVVECAIAVAMRELYGRNSCTMIWYDDRSASGTSVYPMENPLDFEKVYPVIATAPLSHSTHDIAALTAFTDGSRAVAMLFVTPRLDARTVSDLIASCAASGVGAINGAFRVWYCPPAEKVHDFDQDNERRCIEQLAAAGIMVEKVTHGMLSGDGLAAFADAAPAVVSEDAETLVR